VKSQIQFQKSTIDKIDPRKEAKRAPCGKKSEQQNGGDLHVGDAKPKNHNSDSINGSLLDSRLKNWETVQAQNRDEDTVGPHDDDGQDGGRGHRREACSFFEQGDGARELL
tara:strand:+ start:136 stop:468 length:333 start_codon:yes stop_codon:yes gene_type:complete